MIKINLYGGPGSGKSTLAAEIYSELKKRQLKVELIREYAKELVYQGINMKTLSESERIVILGEQFRRENEVANLVDYLVTDSPMLLTAYYHKFKYAKDVVLRSLNPNEIHLWVERPDYFEKEGRSHSEEESKRIDESMKLFLTECGITYKIIKGVSDKDRIQSVLDIINLKENI